MQVSIQRPNREEEASIKPFDVRKTTDSVRLLNFVVTFIRPIVVRKACIKACVKLSELGT